MLKRFPHSNVSNAHNPDALVRNLLHANMRLVALQLQEPRFNTVQDISDTQTNTVTAFKGEKRLGGTRTIFTERQASPC
jgi:hypothetical protein